MKTVSEVLLYFIFSYHAKIFLDTYFTSSNICPWVTNERSYEGFLLCSKKPHCKCSSPCCIFLNLKLAEKISLCHHGSLAILIVEKTLYSACAYLKASQEAA